MKFKYFDNNKRYYTLNYYYRKRYGQKIGRIALDGGFTCPNIDGSKGYGGCIFCRGGSSSSEAFLTEEFKGFKEYREFKKFKECKDFKAFEDIGPDRAGGSADRMDAIIRSLERQYMRKTAEQSGKWKNDKYIVYFQANTNTYDSVENLRRRFEPFIAKPEVVGLSIATRDDCISDEVFEYLAELNRRTDLTVELGLQTVNERTTEFIGRASTLESFDACVRELRRRGISVVVHIINGLPGETKADMLATARHINALDVQGVKIHNLFLEEGTRLGELYKRQNALAARDFDVEFPKVDGDLSGEMPGDGASLLSGEVSGGGALDLPLKMLTMEEYVDIVCDQLEILRDSIVIHRLTGDPDERYLIAPKWVTKKFVVMNEIDKELRRRNTVQGYHQSVINYARRFWEELLKPNDVAIDATCGNGHDTVYLADILSRGKVYAIDIQREAVEKTAELVYREQSFKESKKGAPFSNESCENSNNACLGNASDGIEVGNVKVLRFDHAKIFDFAGRLLDEKGVRPRLVHFNLGYLPGGDKSVTTKAETTVKAVSDSLGCVCDGGAVTVVVYPGHSEGARESEMLLGFADLLGAGRFKVMRNTDNESAPYLIIFYK